MLLNFKKQEFKGIDYNINNHLNSFYLITILSFIMRGVIPFSIYFMIGSLCMTILLFIISYRKLSPFVFPKSIIWYLYVIVTLIFILSFLFSFYKPVQIKKDLFNVLIINILLIIGLHIFKTIERYRKFLGDLATVFVVLQIFIALIGFLKFVFIARGNQVPFLSQQFNTSLGDDRNMNMMQIVLASAILIYDLMYRADVSKKRKLFYSFVLILFFIVVLFSNSRRGVIILSGIYLLCFCLIINKKLRQRLIYFYFILISIMIIFGTIYSLKPEQRRFIIEKIFYSDNFIDKFTSAFYRYYVVFNSDLNYTEISERIWGQKKVVYTVEHCLELLRIGEFKNGSMAAIHLSSLNETQKNPLWEKHFGNIHDSIFQVQYWSLIPFLISDMQIDFSSLIMIEGYKKNIVLGFEKKDSIDFYSIGKIENESNLGVKFRVPSVSKLKYKCAFVVKGEQTISKNFKNLNKSFNITDYSYYVNKEKDTYCEIELLSNDTLSFTDFYIEFENTQRLEISSITWLLIPANTNRVNFLNVNSIENLEKFVSGYMVSPALIKEYQESLIKMNQVVNGSLKNDFSLKLLKRLSNEKELFYKFESFGTMNLKQDYSGNEEFIITNPNRSYTSIGFPAWDSSKIFISFKLIIDDGLEPYCSRLFITPEYFGTGLVYNDTNYLTIIKSDSFYDVNYNIQVKSNPTGIGQIIIGLNNGKLNQKFIIKDFKYKIIIDRIDKMNSMSVYQYEKLENFLKTQDFFEQRVNLKILNDSIEEEKLKLFKIYKCKESSIENKFLKPRIDRLNIAYCFFNESSISQKIFGSGFKYITEFPILLKPINISEMLKADSPHNPVIASVLYSGLLGGFFVFLFFAYMIYLVITQFYKQPLICVSFLIVLLFSFVSGNTFFSIPLFLILTILFLLSIELTRITA